MRRGALGVWQLRGCASCVRAMTFSAARRLGGFSSGLQEAIKAAEQQLKAAAQQPGYCIKVLKVGWT